MKAARLVVVVVLVVTGSVSLTAQTSPDLENGFKNYGSYDGTHVDSVNLQNGNLILHAPLLPNYPQRGKLGMQPLVVFNSKAWQVICAENFNNLSCGWFHGGTGVTMQYPTDLGLQRTIDVFFSGTGTSYSAFGYSLTGPDGAAHQLFPTVTVNGLTTEYETLDTSGYHVVLSGSDGSGVPNTATVTDRAGSQYVAIFDAPSSCGPLPVMPVTPAARLGNWGIYASGLRDDTPRGDEYCPQWTGAQRVTDSNGNVINTINPANNDPGSDSLARPLPLGTFVATSDYSGCVNSNPITGAWLLSYSAPDGSIRQLKMCFEQVIFQTAFNQPGVEEASFGPALPPGSNRFQADNALPLLATVVLADGTKWIFNYDGYVHLTSVSLPSGGSITYTWTTVALSSGCGGLTTMSRAVASRTLNDGQGHSSTWTYNWGTPSNGVVINKVTDPLLNDSVHTFTAVDGTGGCAFYETRTQYYQGAQDPAHLLKQVDTTYYPPLMFLTDAGESVAGNVLAKDITTSVYPSGKVSRVHREYDTGMGTGKPIFGNVKKELEYDWGQGTPGALLRETDTTYQWETNSAYLTAHLLDLPASVIVKDAGGNRAAETDYSYDEPTYLTTPNPAISTQHNTAPPAGVRGNQTTISRWLNTTNSFIASHTKWYDTGEPYQVIDPLGHTTTHSYDPFYKGAYGTQTCSPTTNGVVHCVSGTYDFNTGVLTSLTNENAGTQASGNTPGDSGHTSNYAYDFMFRITSAQAPPDPANNGLHAQTNFTFSSPGALPITVQRTKSVTTALSDSATSFFDGVGRGYKGQHLLPNGTATVDTTFDLAGHPATVSNPYFTTSDPTYGAITNTYDGLDRVTQTTKQDGSISRVAYNVITGAHDAVPGANFIGDCTDTADEAGKQRRACVDGLGRLVMVVEPNPGAAATTATGNITINGNEQTTGGAATPGSATIMISGNEQSGQYCPAGHCHTVWDAGTVTISIAGFAAKTVTYSQSDTTATVAWKLSCAFHNDTAGPADASCPQSAGSSTSVVLTARATGFVTNYSFTTSSATTDTTGVFGGPSFSAGPASGAFTGGNNAGISDNGNITVTVNATNYTVSFGAGDTGSAIASRLATAMSGSTVVSVAASGNQVNLTSKTAGSAGNAALSASYTWNNSVFAQPSFTMSASGVFGGYDAVLLDNNPYKTLYTYDTLGNLLRVDQKGSAPTDSTQWRTRTFTYDSLSRLLTATNPESGAITYSYDADGELLQKTSPAPNQTGTATQTVSYCYDELHRVTGRGYGAQSCPLATPVVSYVYDSGDNAKGKLTSLADQAGTASYAYDILGRLASETRTLTGANNASISKIVSYEYNLDGSLSKLHYPSGAVVTYTPDSAGRTLSAVDSGSGINYVTGATYGPDSALTGFVSGNSGTFAGITNSFAYNKRLQPLTMSATAPSQTVYSIGYDFHAGNGTAGNGSDNGNVFGIINYKDTTHGRDQTFTYDALNRLTSAQNAGTNCATMVLGNKAEYWGNSYGYDAWGNLLQKTITKCGAEHMSVTADAHNWLHASGTDYQYDAAGNMTYDATASLGYTFDQENRLTGAAGYTYTYDGDGNRVRKSNGNLAANGTLYWYMTPGVVAESDLAGTLKSEYVFFDGERVARRDGATGAGGVFYYFSDHLKTASVITDAAGTIKAESDYYPWGGELQFVNNDSNDYKFTGKKRDTETGLDYFGARYYSNGLGRFVSADWSATPVPVPYADLTDPQTLTLYGYVRGLPTTKPDIDGHSWWQDLKKKWNDFWAEQDKKEEEDRKHDLWVLRDSPEAQQYAKEHGGVTPLEVYHGLIMATAGAQADFGYGPEPTQPAPPAGETQAGETAQVEVTISRSKSPASAQHIDDAQAAGKPSVVTLDRSGEQGAARAAARGRAATSGTPTSPGMDRDEYPPKCCAEGGSGASVRPIPASDNRSAGGQLGQQTKTLPDGTKVKIKTGP